MSQPSSDQSMRTVAGTQSQIQHLQAPVYINDSLALTSDWTFFKSVAISFVVGIVCLVLALSGLALWGQADYFHDPGPYSPNSWCGYDKRTFVGLVMFTTFSTIGFTLVYVAVFQALRARPRRLTVFAYCAAASVFIVMGCTAMTWGKEMFKCFGIFCVGPDYNEVPNARPEAGIGFFVTIGVFAFFSLVPFGLIMLATGFRAASNNKYSSPLARQQKSETVPALPEDPLGMTLRTLVVILALLLFAWTTTYIPNSWEYIVAARIAKNANIRVSANGTLCNDEYNLYTCPEVSWAVFATTTFEVSEHLVLKFYPGNVFFFVYLLGLVVFVSVMRFNRHGRLFLKSSISCHISGRGWRKFFNWTVGEALLLIATIVLFVNFFVYWFHDHNYNGYWVGGTERNITDAERWARTLGQVAVLFMSLLFFPASRNSVMHHMLGTSWESFLLAHRVLGYGMLAAVFGHMVAWYKFYDLLGFFPRDIFDVPLETPTSIDNFTVPLNTLSTFVMFIAMGILALNPIRRRFFEVFYYSHLFAAYLAIPAVLWHAAAGWEYLIPGLTVWFLDRCVRLARSNQVVVVRSVRSIQDFVEIKWSQPQMKAQPGQYVFINIPEISLFEWHPFTLSSGVGSEFFSVHIKPMGDGSWTQRLSSLVGSGSTNFSLAVDGPYGHAITYSDYKRVILIAGGIGITPCASIYKSMKASPLTRPVILWSLREELLATAFDDQFAPEMPRLQETAAATSEETLSATFLDQERRARAGSMSAALARDAGVRIFLTSKGTVSKAVASVPGVFIVAGQRMDMRHEFGHHGQGLASDSVLVFVCGPEAMVEHAQELANHFGYHFHRETFLL
jgi:predicted ferric reductase